MTDPRMSLSLRHMRQFHEHTSHNWRMANPPFDPPNLDQLQPGEYAERAPDNWFQSVRPIWVIWSKR